MEVEIPEKYNYYKSKKYILDFLNLVDNFKEQDFKLLSDKLDYLIEASKELGLPFIYLLLALKSQKTEKNLGSFFISLYFEEREKEKIEKLFYLIYDAFNFIGPKDYHISNPIEVEFLKNVDNFEILNYDDIPRPKLNEIEIIYFKIASALDCYNTNLALNEDNEDGIKEVKTKYDECKKEIENLKNNKTIKNLKFNIDFFKDLLKSIDFNKLYKKEDDKMDAFSYEINENEIKKINLDLSLSRSSSKNFSQHLEKIPLKHRKFFVLNKKVSFGEDIETEFKNYRFFEKNEIISYQLIEKIQKLICVLLNNKGERIYFGIDDYKFVKGNRLNYKQRDDLRLELLNLTSNFYPDCKTSKIKIDFIPVKDYELKILTDIFVTKIIVRQGDPDKLYSISNKDYISYKRLQGQNTHLKPEVIAEEIFKRRSKPEDPIPDKEFMDPEPEIIYEDNYFKINSDLPKFKKKKKKNKMNNTISVKVTNISEDVPIEIHDNLFSEYNDIIENKVFFQNNSLSSGYGYIDAKDMNSAIQIIKEFNGMNVYGKKLNVFLKNNIGY